MSSVRFISPINGDFVNERDGCLSDGILHISVTLDAPKGHALSVCGIAAEYSDGLYRASVPVCGYR